MTTLDDIRRAMNRTKITYIAMKREGTLVVDFGYAVTYLDAYAKMNIAFPTAYRLSAMKAANSGECMQMLLSTEQEITYFKLIANNLE